MSSQVAAGETTRYKGIYINRNAAPIAICSCKPQLLQFYKIRNTNFLDTSFNLFDTMDLFKRTGKKSHEERLAENARLVGPEMAAVRQIYPKSHQPVVGVRIDGIY